MNKKIKKYNKNIFILLLLILLYIRIIQIEYKKKNNYSSTPKISIFLPIYNKAMFLKRSINSIQIQTLRNIEIIAVNDYSDDNSLEILFLFHLLLEIWFDNIYNLFSNKIHSINRIGRKWFKNKNCK